MTREIGRKTIVFGDQHFPDVRDQIVRTIWAAITAHIAAKIAALLAQVPP